jgi:hypothetical protein
MVACGDMPELMAPALVLPGLKYEHLCKTKRKKDLTK